MIIGVPKEIKKDEYRAAVTPSGVKKLVEDKNTVLVEKNLGVGSGFSDKEYKNAGAKIFKDPAQIFSKSDMIVKVKEPQPSEFKLFKKGQTLFAYIHSESHYDALELLLKKKITAIAYENIRLEDGNLPLLIPMSQIAGQVGTVIGIELLQVNRGGKGVSIIKAPNVDAAKVIVLGGGYAGYEATKIAGGVEADVILYEISPKRIKELKKILPENVSIVLFDRKHLVENIQKADLVINTATIPPNSKTHIVTIDMVMMMKKGSVIMDITSNIKGAIETIDKYTSHSNPTYTSFGVIHCCIPNIPGVVPNTSTQALSTVTLPYIQKLASNGILESLKNNKAVRTGLTCIDGILTWKEAGDTFGKKYVSSEEALGI